MKLKYHVCVMCTAILFSVQPMYAQEPFPPSELMRVTKYELVSKKRVGRSVLEYEYALTVENNSDEDYDGVYVVFGTELPSVEPVDNQAGIGNFEAQSETSAIDTIKFRVDRREPFDPTQDLLIVFDNDTLLGIDADNNGIRDDIDSAIAVSYRERTARLIAAIQEVSKNYMDIFAFEPSADGAVSRAKALAESGGIATYCVMKFAESPSEAQILLSELKAQILNRTDRIESNEVYNSLLSGQSLEVDFDAVTTFCSGL